MYAPVCLCMRRKDAPNLVQHDQYLIGGIWLLSKLLVVHLQKKDILVQLHELLLQSPL